MRRKNITVGGSQVAAVLGAVAMLASFNDGISFAADGEADGRLVLSQEMVGPAGSAFGTAVATLPDIDGGGIGDILVSAPAEGVLWVLSGEAPSSPPLAEIPAPSGATWFGEELAVDSSGGIVVTGETEGGPTLWHAALGPPPLVWEAFPFADAAGIAASPDGLWVGTPEFEDEEGSSGRGAVYLVPWGELDEPVAAPRWYAPQDASGFGSALGWSAGRLLIGSVDGRLWSLEGDVLEEIDHAEGAVVTLAVADQVAVAADGSEGIRLLPSEDWIHPPAGSDRSFSLGWHPAGLLVGSSSEDRAYLYSPEPNPAGRRGEGGTPGEGHDADVAQDWQGFDPAGTFVDYYDPVEALRGMVVDASGGEDSPPDSSWQPDPPRTTQTGEAPDGTPIPLLVDGASGNEVIVDGVFTHSITFDVPAGRGALAPSAGLSFANGAPGDLLGRHWSLTGFESVQRRGPSGGHPQGGVDDTFWFEGVRLIRVGSTVQGPLYRPENGGGGLFRYDGASDVWIRTSDGLTTVFGEVRTTEGVIGGETEVARPLGVFRADNVLGESIPGWQVDPGRVSSRWWIGRTRDESFNSVLYEYEVARHEVVPPQFQWGAFDSVMPTRISWGQGQLTAPDPNQPAGERDYRLTYEYSDSPELRPRASSGFVHAEGRILTSVLLDGPSRTQLDRWTFTHEIARPSGQPLLSEIWQHGARLPDVPVDAPIRLRRFHYRHTLVEPLLPGSWESLSAEGLDEAILAGRNPSEPAVLWESEVPVGLDLPDAPPGYDAVPHLQFASLNHDALPDVLVLWVQDAWSGLDRPARCRADCSALSAALGTECTPERRPVTCHEYGSIACSQVFRASVLINTGDFQFRHDPVASSVLDVWLASQGRPRGSWMSFVNALLVEDLNRDGMSDLVGPESTLLSHPTGDLRSLAGIAASGQWAPPPDPQNGSSPARLGAHVDIDGDGHADVVSPPSTTIESWGRDEMLQVAQRHFGFLAEDDVVDYVLQSQSMGGLCIVPRGVNAAPVWRMTTGARWPEGEGQSLSILAPLFGGPMTEQLGGPAMSLPVGIRHEFLRYLSAAEALTPTEDETTGPTIIPPDWQSLLNTMSCEVGGQTGVLIPSTTLARMDHTKGDPYLAPNGWAYIARHLEWADVNADGCADVSIAMDTAPLKELGDNPWGLELNYGLPEQADDFYSDLFYGDCTGQFVRATEPLASSGLDWWQTHAHTTAGLGAPSLRYRSDGQEPVSCNSQPYNGMRLTNHCNLDEHENPFDISASWALPWCQAPSTGAGSVCCTACGDMFDLCEAWRSEGNSCPEDAVEEEFDELGNPIPNNVLPPQDFSLPNMGTPPGAWTTASATEPFDPLLSHLTGNRSYRPAGPSLTPTIAGQWVDLDRDGRSERLELCSRTGTEGVLELSEEGDPATYMLGVHYPKSSGNFSTNLGASCAERGAQNSDIAWLGVMSQMNGSRPAPLGGRLGAEPASLLLDLDGDGFADHVTAYGTELFVRRNARIEAEGSLTAITYPWGTTSDLADPTTWTGTSYLYWRVGDPREHPLLPYPEVSVAAVIDANGFRTFQRRGCRYVEGREVGCHTVVEQNHRGGVVLAAHSTHPDLGARTWLSATYEADGQLVEVRTSLVDFESAAIQEPRDTDLRQPILREAGPTQPVSDLPPAGGLQLDSSAVPIHPNWRDCRHPVPAGAFDTRLEQYVRECLDYSSPHLGGRVGRLADLEETAVQTARAWPLHSGPLDLVPPLPVSGSPGHGTSTGMHLFVVERELAQDWPVEVVSYDHGMVGSLEDDSATRRVHGPLNLHGRRVLRATAEGFGSHAGVLRDVEFAHERFATVEWTRHSTTGGSRQRSITLDPFGRVETRIDEEGRVSRETRGACGGVSSTVRLEGYAGSPWAEKEFDERCRTVEARSSTGSVISTVIGTHGLARQQSVDPSGGQPVMTAWMARDRAPSGYGSRAQEYSLTADRLSMTFHDVRGRVVLTRSCPAPTSPAGPFDLDPRTIDCDEELSLDLRYLYDEDSRLIAESEPHPTGAADVFWTRWLFDSLGRQTFETGQMGTPLGPSPMSPPLEPVARYELHDRERVVFSTGMVTETVASAGSTEVFVDGEFRSRRTVRPDGLVVETEDAAGRVVVFDYDGWGKLDQRLDPWFQGAEAGQEVGIAPTTEHTWTPAGRSACRTNPLGVTRCVARDPLGRPAMVGVVDSSAPIIERLWSHPDPWTPSDVVGGGLPPRTKETIEADGDRATQLVDGVGRVVGRVWSEAESSLEFDDAGLLAATVDRRGLRTEVSHTWLPGGRQLITSTQPQRETVSYELRDHRGATLRTVDADGVSSEFEYDARGRLIRSWVGGHSPLEFDVHPQGQLLRELEYDPHGRISRDCPGGVGSGLVCEEFQYDGEGRLVHRVRGVEETTYGWNPDGSLAWSEVLTPDAAALYEWQYDGAGHVIDITRDGQSTGVDRYDALGRPALHIPDSSLGLGTSWSLWDERGLLVEEHVPSQMNPRRYGYWPDGRLQWIENGDEQFGAHFGQPVDTWHTWDAEGRPESETDILGLTVSYAYQGPDRVAATTTGSSGVVEQRMEQVVEPLTGRVQQERTALTQDCAATLDVGSCPTSEWTFIDRGWTAAGRRASVTDANGNATHWTLDTANHTGRVVGELSATLERTFEFDEFGRPSLEFVGTPGLPEQMIEREWDAYGRLEETVWSTPEGTEQETFEYDTAGRAVWTEVRRNGAPVEAVHRTFDSRGRVFSLAQELGGSPVGAAGDEVCDSGELCFERDLLGRVQTVTYPDQRQVGFTWGDAGLERAFEGGSPAGATVFEVLGRDALGRPEETWSAGDVGETVLRRADGRVVYRSVVRGTSAPAPDSATETWSTWDEFGRLLEKGSVHTGASLLSQAETRTQYRYNAAGWLIGETTDGEDWEQTFDRVGNRLSRTAGGGKTTTQAWGPDNRLESMWWADGTTQVFAYDGLGRRLNDDEGQGLSWTPRGRLEEVIDVAGDVVAAFASGVGGLRVGESSAMGDRTFQYGPSGWLPWVTSSASGDFNEVVVGGTSLLTLQPSAGPATLERGLDGTAEGWTDGSGLVWQGRYGSYGEPVDSGGLPPTEGWQGLLGNEADVRYLGAAARDYDPTTATWLQPDPLGVDGDISLYRYAEGDPVNKADPSGLCVDLEEARIAADEDSQRRWQESAPPMLVHHMPTEPKAHFTGYMSWWALETGYEAGEFDQSGNPVKANRCFQCSTYGVSFSTTRIRRVPLHRVLNDVLRLGQGSAEEIETEARGGDADPAGAGPETMAGADDLGGSGEAGLLDGSIGMTPGVGVDARVMVDDSGRSGLQLMLADVVPRGSDETAQQTYYLALRKHWNVHPILAWNIAGDLSVSGEYSNGAETDVWLTMDVVEFMDSEFNPVGVSNSNYLGSGKTIDAGNREAARKITNVFGGMAFGLLAAPVGAALGGGLLAGAAATGSRLVVAGASVGLSVAGGIGTVTAAVQTAHFVDKFLGSTMFGGAQVTANDAFAMSSMAGGGLAGSAAAGIGSRVARLRPNAAVSARGVDAPHVDSATTAVGKPSSQPARSAKAGPVPLGPNRLVGRSVSRPTQGEGGVYQFKLGGKTKTGSTVDFYQRYSGGEIEVEFPQTRSGPAADDAAYRWTPRRQRRFDEHYIDSLLPPEERYRSAIRPVSPVSADKWERFRHIFGY